MAQTVLGPAVDLHGGGADLAFPHHAYEAAMAEAASGVVPFARRWVRVGVVGIDGAKMAKSAGPLVLVQDLLTTHEAAAVRLLLLHRRWWEAWDYHPEQLDAAAAALEALYSAAARPGSGAGVEAVAAAMRDDLDVPTALQAADEAGGPAARFALHVLGLDAAHR
jgi:cysteinyl-tRNA synthetase